MEQLFIESDQTRPISTYLSSWKENPLKVLLEIRFITVNRAFHMAPSLGFKRINVFGHGILSLIVLIIA